MRVPKPGKEGDDYGCSEAAVQTRELSLVSFRFTCCFIPLSLPALCWWPGTGPGGGGWGEWGGYQMWRSAYSGSCRNCVCTRPPALCAWHSPPPAPGPGPDRNPGVEARRPRTRRPSLELNASLPLALREWFADTLKIVWETTHFEQSFFIWYLFANTKPSHRTSFPTPRQSVSIHFSQFKIKFIVVDTAVCNAMVLIIHMKFWGEKCPRKGFLDEGFLAGLCNHP